MSKLGILATHPIQYYSPLFRELAGRSGWETEVYYAHKPSDQEQGTGFGVPFQWDVDLLSGYSSFWLKNISKAPTLENYGGCDAPEIANVLEAKKFDAFLVTGWNKKVYWQAMRAAWKTGTPLFVRADSQLASKTPLLKRIGKKIMYPKFMKRFKACLAVGERSEAYFRYYGAKNIFRSPHFVDNARFETASEPFRQAHDKFTFLFAGKFEEKKRPMDILKALSRMPATLRSRVKVVMVGDGVLKTACKDFAEQKALPVTFTGFANQSLMPRYYAEADVLILPSDGRETWGLVVNEAMACGVPAIVSSAVGCTPDLIKEGVTGFSYDCGDIATLTALMADMASSPEKIQKMREAVRVHIRGFSAEKAAEGVLQAISKGKT